jgi:dephospho-CoA kinase
MGKSTTSRLFREAGVPVWDADAAVHALYARGGAAVVPLGRLVPQAICDGAVDRTALKAAIAGDAGLIARIEAIVHPLVRADRAAFVAAHRDAPVVVLDIPLLYETGGESDCDAVAVVSTDPETQRSRAMERPGMTPEHFEMILARQVPDAEKRVRADYVIDTSHGVEPARAQVKTILEDIERRLDA